MTPMIMSSSQSQVPAGRPNLTSPSTPSNQKTSGETPSWPLSYRLNTIPKSTSNNNNNNNGSHQQQQQRQWWHHYLYRNTQGQNPTIIYCKTKEQSQKAAELFLGLPVVGFDMEWPWDDYKRTGLKNKVSLIQLASEDRIALFHIALHQGTTVDDLIAPALRAILESPAISKVGVSVMNADFARLIRFFGLKPKGAFELSHLHNLVHYGEEEYDLITTKLVSLKKQVEEHLGLPLWKGETRTSDWSKPLTPQQLTYAVDDAYAGYMLYHCMNAKRLAMTIVPTLPVHVDRYPGIHDRPGNLMNMRSVWLQPERPGAGIYTAADFFRKAKGIPIEKRKDPKDDAQIDTKQSSSQNSPKQGVTTFDGVSKELHDLLKAQRTRLSSSENVPAYIIATNAELEAMAVQRPTTLQQLLRIHGMGPRKAGKYGNIWLGIIRRFVKEKKLPLTEQAPATPKANIKRVGQSLEFKGSPPTPQTHTGLSFSMADTNITADENKRSWEESDDDEPAFGSPIPTPSRENVKRRRYDVLQPRSISDENVPGRTSPGKLGVTGGNVAASPATTKVVPVASPTAPSRAPAKPTPTLSKEVMIFEKKLTALSRMVALKSPPEQRQANPVISAATIRQLALKPPNTAQELMHIPGIAPFVRACADAKIDLMNNISKWKPAAEPSPT